MSEVLRAQGLERHYPLDRTWFGPRRTLHAVNGVDLVVHSGRTLALVGESGCGKSTLGRLLAFVDHPDAGRIDLDGERVTPALLKRSRAKVQIVFQNPHASLNPRKTIASLLDEPLAINTRLDRRARTHKVLAWLEQVGLSAEYASRYPHMLSGGQKQRIAIARAMILEPRLVVADEPTSALDVSIQAQIINLFRELQSRYGTSFVFISHDFGVVRHVADQVAVMYLGTVVELGPAAALFNRPRHPYTRALLAAMPTLGGTLRANHLGGEPPSPIDIPAGCPLRNRCPQAQFRCAHDAPSLRAAADDAEHQLACHFA